MERLHLATLAALLGCGPLLAPHEQPAQRPPEPQITELAGRLPQAIAGASATFSGGRALVSGGLLSAWPGIPAVTNCTDSVQALDPDTGELTPAGTLPAAARGHLFFEAPGGELMTAMGYCGMNTSVESEVFALRATGPALIGAVPVGAFYPVGGVMVAPDAGVVLSVAGGYGSGPERDNIQRINVVSGSARDLAIKLPRPRPLGAGTVSGNVLYMLGGSDLGEPPATTGTNPLSDEIVAISMWPDSATVVAHLPEPSMGGCAVSQSDGTVLVFGGAHYVAGDGGLVLEPSDRVVIFTPATGAVSYSSVTLPSPAAGLACAVAPDDRVFLFGGATTAFAPTTSIVEYDPSSWVASHSPDPNLVANRQLRVAMGCSEAGGTPLAAATLLAFLALLSLGRTRSRGR